MVPRKVHLVGSIALESVEEVFRTAGTVLGHRLALSPATEVCLGLVHGDGVEATKKRIETAARYVPDFGIATECGMARCRTPELVHKLFSIHAEASREPERHARSAPEVRQHASPAGLVTAPTRGREPN
jgi:hypothetical protein